MPTSAPPLSCPCLFLSQCMCGCVFAIQSQSWLTCPPTPSHCLPVLHTCPQSPHQLRRPCLPSCSSLAHQSFCIYSAFSSCYCSECVCCLMQSWDYMILTLTSHLWKSQTRDKLAFTWHWQIDATCELFVCNKWPVYRLNVQILGQNLAICVTHQPHISARMKFSCTVGLGTTNLNHTSNYKGNGAGAICSGIILTLHIIHGVEQLKKWWA